MSQGTTALASFNKFLQKQGDAIRFPGWRTTRTSQDHHGGGHSGSVQGGQRAGLCAERSSSTASFDRQNSKFTSACASAEFVDIYFNYLYAANVFDYEALKDPGDQARDFDNFIQKQRKAQIEEADTFFNDDFPAPGAKAGQPQQGHGVTLPVKKQPADARNADQL